MTNAIRIWLFLNFSSRFLEWLFDRLRAELLMEEAGNNVVLWSHLPFFGKFLGDGILTVIVSVSNAFVIIGRVETPMTKGTRNVGKVWTEDDISQLRELAKENRPLRIIGIKLGRTPDAIRTKASEKGISLRRKSPSP